MSFITGWASNVGRAYRHRRARSLGLLPPEDMPEYEDNSSSSSSRLIDSIAGRFHKDSPADLRRLDSVKAEGDRKLRAKMERGLPAFQERSALSTHDEHEETESDQPPEKSRPVTVPEVQQGSQQHVQDVARESVHGDNRQHYATHYEAPHGAHSSFAGPSRHHQAPPAHSQAQYTQHDQYTQYTEPVQPGYQPAHFNASTSAMPDASQPTFSQYDHHPHAYAPDTTSYYAPHHSYLPSQSQSRTSQFAYSQSEWSHTHVPAPAPESSDWHTNPPHQQQYAQQFSSYYAASISTPNLLATGAYGESSATARPMSYGEWEAPVSAAPAMTTPYDSISPGGPQYQPYAGGLSTHIQPLTTPEPMQASPSRSRPLPTPMPRRATYHNPHTSDPAYQSPQAHTMAAPHTPDTMKVLPRPPTAQTSKPTLESKGPPPSRSRPLPTPMPSPATNQEPHQNSDADHIESQNDQEQADISSPARPATTQPSAPSTPTHAVRLRGPRLPSSSSSPSGAGRRISSYELVPGHVQSSSSSTS